MKPQRKSRQRRATPHVDQERERRDAHTQANERREHAPAPSGQLYGVAPVLEALRAGGRRVERITVAEGAHEARLHELFE